MKCDDSSWKKCVFLSVLFNDAVNRHFLLGEMVLMSDSPSTWRHTCSSDSFLRQIENKISITLYFLTNITNICQHFNVT